MNQFSILLVSFIVALVATGSILWCLLKTRNYDKWIASYYFPTDPQPCLSMDDEPIDVYLAVCDHYEPQRGNAPKEVALSLVKRWVQEYPERFDQFRDVDGKPPQHTFFFPQDEYQPEYLDLLKRLCEAGFGDVDVHLHHRHDTAESLAEKLNSFRETLYNDHGLLRRDPTSGEIVYGFIHGNWALCNSRPDGDWCGVDQELTVLKETGCYADFTMPSAPSPTQTKTINSIYYAKDIPGQCKSHNTGIAAAVGRQAPEDTLLMVQGPLVPDWKRAKFGVIPRVENGDITGGRPATWSRFQLWQQANVHVKGAPNKRFIKLHTHGCKEGNIDTWLGPEMEEFHQKLAEEGNRNPNFRLHYVTAWQMAQEIHTIEKQDRRDISSEQQSVTPTMQVQA